MSHYFIECCQDHLNNMTAREDKLLNALIKMAIEHKTLKLERENLQLAIKNWIKEEEDMK